jgi:hypothetical protein
VNWLHEPLAVMPDVQAIVWVLLWVIDDSPFENVCCISIEIPKALFGVTGSDRNPTVIIIIVTSIVPTFILMFLMLKYH